MNKKVHQNFVIPIPPLHMLHLLDLVVVTTIAFLVSEGIALLAQTLLVVVTWLSRGEGVGARGRGGWRHGWRARGRRRVVLMCTAATAAVKVAAISGVVRRR